MIGLAEVPIRFNCLAYFAINKQPCELISTFARPSTVVAHYFFFAARCFDFLIFAFEDIDLPFDLAGLDLAFEARIFGALLALLLALLFAFDLTAALPLEVLELPVVRRALAAAFFLARTAAARAASSANGFRSVIALALHAPGAAPPGGKNIRRRLFLYDPDLKLEASQPS